jgi:cell division protein FtsW
VSQLKPRQFIKSFQQQNVNYDWQLVGVIVALIVGGLAFLASALATAGIFSFQSEFLKQLVFGVWLGSVLAFILAKVDYHYWFIHKNKLLLGTVVLLGFIAVFILIADLLKIPRDVLLANINFLPIKPYAANGAIRWISISFLPNFQPSELAKLTILIYFAAFLNNLKSEEISWMKLKKPVYAFILTSFLILLQPDLGTVILIALIVLSGMWIVKTPIKILAILGIVVIIGGSILTLTYGYRRNRFEAIFNPDSGVASQISLGQLAIQKGGLWGLGYGNSESKQQGLIYEGSTDLIITIIAEEMGFVFTAAFLSLYLILVYRSLQIAKNAPDPGGSALAIGIGVWLGTQAFLNLAGVLGLLPLKGFPLPFVSEGGSAMVLNLMAIGVLLNISSQGNVEKRFTPIPKLSKSKFVKG